MGLRWFFAAAVLLVAGGSIQESIDDKLDALSFSFSRLDSIFSQLANIESKLDSCEKLELSNEYLSRRLETVSEKMGNKVSHLDAKLDMKLERMIGKLELLERELRHSLDDSLARLARVEEEKFERMVRELRAELVDTLTGRTAFNEANELLENLTARVERALTMGEAKFRELDSDVELYTKKVVSGMQELWRTSDALKVDLSQTLEQGSRTREMVRREFRRLHEQIEPKLEPRDVSEELERKVSELSATVDSSYAALLLAQNTFIDSCRRIQQEELHVYDILQEIVQEMRRNRHRVSSELQRQSSQIRGAIDRVLATVTSTDIMLATRLLRCGGSNASEDYTDSKTMKLA